jgi:phosphoglycerate kinase
MPIRSLPQLHIASGDTVLVRVDYNVSIKNKRVVEDEKIRASISTIHALQQKGAKVLLVSHLGRPEGKIDMNYTLEPVRKVLEHMLDKKVVQLKSYITVASSKEVTFDIPAIRTQIEKMKPGDVALFENIRFAAGEERNDRAFAKVLASFADAFVLDGFAVSHRDSASVSGVAEFLPTCAGTLLEREIKSLGRVMDAPKKPFCLILGGVKMETKIPVLKKLLPKTQSVLLGGGIANTYFAARGYGVGKSVIDSAYTKEIVQYAKQKKVILPVDVVVGTPDGKQYRVVSIEKKPHQICKRGEMILDLGPVTLLQYAAYIEVAKTIVWNGGMGYMEVKPYDIGTLTIARLVAQRSRGAAYGVVGGGETITALNQTKMSQYVDVVSTGGGAMLEFLSGKQLPGVKVVTKKWYHRI